MKSAFAFLVACALFLSTSFAHAQTQPVSVDPKQVANLAQAQRLIARAHGLVQKTQAAKSAQLEGHANNAMNFLSQANGELKEAAIAEREYQARLKRAN